MYAVTVFARMSFCIPRKVMSPDEAGVPGYPWGSTLLSFVVAVGSR